MASAAIPKGYRCLKSCVTSDSCQVDASEALWYLKWHQMLVSGQLNQALKVNRGKVRKVKLSFAYLWFVVVVKYQHIMLI